MATAPPVQISGNVHTSGGAPVGGVVMSGLPGNPTTDASGNYSAQVPSGWSGAVTPTLSGYTFSPPSRSYGSVSASQSGQDFVATAPPVQISGNVHTSGGAPVGGVVMSGLPGNPTTDASGNYSAQVPSGWSGAVTPTLSGYTFSPPSRSYGSVSASQSEQDFVATALPVQISGNVHTSGGAPVGGVVMSGLPGNPTTDASGNYSAQVPSGWSGAVTPTLSGYTFSPPSRSYGSVSASQSGQDFVATAPPVQISGNVHTSGGAAVNGVVMSGLPGTPATDGSGNYSAQVSSGWSGTVTPSLSGYAFSPPSRSYGSLSASQSGQDFVAAPTPTGSLQVTILPRSAASAGAQWQVDGGLWQTSGTTLFGLPVGDHAVAFSTVSGWTAPASQTVVVILNQTVATNGTYVWQTGSLEVTVTPSGAVSAGAQWQIDGGTWQSSGTTNYGLAVGSHTIAFSTVTGWMTPSNQTVSVTLNQTTVANAANPESSGAFTLTTTAKGSFSGTMQLAGTRYSLSGQFDTTGQASKVITRRSLSSLTVDLQLDLSPGADQLSGTVSDGTWTAELTADRAVFDGRTSIAPQAGQYTLVIPGDHTSTTEAGGYSYGTLTVSKAGTVSCQLYLADGTKLTPSGSVSRHGQWPLYASLSSGQGLVFSWISFTNTPTEDLTGALVWTKPGAPSSRYYPNGFTLATTVSGSEYIQPAKGANVLTLTDGSVALEGGDLTQNITDQISLGANNRVTDLSGNKLSMTFTPSTGLFTGRLIDPATGKPVLFNGVALQKPNAGYGYFLGTSHSGQALLQGP